LVIFIPAGLKLARNNEYKAAEIAGYSEKYFIEILLPKGISPIKYGPLDVDKELQNA